MGDSVVLVLGTGAGRVKREQPARAGSQLWPFRFGTPSTHGGARHTTHHARHHTTRLPFSLFPAAAPRQKASPPSPEPAVSSFSPLRCLYHHPHHHLQHSTYALFPFSRSDRCSSSLPPPLAQTLRNSEPLSHAHSRRPRSISTLDASLLCFAFLHRTSTSPTQADRSSMASRDSNGPQ